MIMEFEKEQKIYDIPATLSERHALRDLISQRMTELCLQPPLSMDDLSAIADDFISEQALDNGLKGWIMVEIHNHAWMKYVASIPYERRLLLLPKCLSSSSHCRAEVDEFGLLCHRCGRCVIPNLEQKAEELGAMSMVAEGFTTVVELIKNRVVDCVIGVSCLNSLEKAFPMLISHAVPGLAIPLNFDGCKDTQVDEGYVMQMLSMNNGEQAFMLDYDRLSEEVRSWFEAENLRRHLSTEGQTSEVAMEWVGQNGKRWRPYLLAATYSSLVGTDSFPPEVIKAALGVECFHKASLIHDDIQDDDDMRYGKPCVHISHGVPMAINIGDALLGEGYKLLSECNHPELLAVVAKAHLELCQGQGMELEWTNHPAPITLNYALDIFRKKTVPAFDVSLQLGLICAGGDEELKRTFHDYSMALGVAYQLEDDLDDFNGQEKLVLRPSAVLGVLCESAGKDFIDALLHTDDVIRFLNTEEHRPILQSALNKVKALAEFYHQEALGSLYRLKNVELKRLLFRVTERILK